MVDLFLTGRPVRAIDLKTPRAVSYEHIRVSGGAIEFAGEHVMSNAGPLRLIAGFCGADEAITNHQSDRSEWVATLIISAADHPEVECKRKMVLDNIERLMT
jgi:pyrrolysine biosynthesis protein PylC